MIHRVLKYIAFVEMIGFLACIFPVMFLFAKYSIFGIIVPYLFVFFAYGCRYIYIVEDKKEMESYEY